MAAAAGRAGRERKWDAPSTASLPSAAHSADRAGQAQPEHDRSCDRVLHQSALCQGSFPEAGRCLPAKHAQKLFLQQFCPGGFRHGDAKCRHSLETTRQPVPALPHSVRLCADVWLP